MKSLLFLPATALLFSVTMYPSHPARAASDSMPAPAPTSKIWVENEQVFLGETIHLLFLTPHPQYLGVIDPGGSFFYVVFPVAESMGKLTPLVDSEVFINLNHLEINTAQIKADPYKYGVLENQPVFTKSGAYTFILGDNLHVDDPTAVYRVTVKYQHKTRPVQHAVVIN